MASGLSIPLDKAFELSKAQYRGDARSTDAIDVTYVASPNSDTFEARKPIWTPSGSRRGPEICAGKGWSQ